MTKSLPPKTLVLYADDDPDDIELVSEAFREHTQNLELRAFSDGIELLRHIDELDPLSPPPCLFILDINMPRLNGKETLRRIRNHEKYSDVPAVLFTTSTLPSDAHFAERFNAGFVTKPLLTQQVYQIIDQIIDNCSDEVKKMIRKNDK